VQELVDYMVRSVVKHPDDINLDVSEGDASVLLELNLHDDDRALLTADDGKLISAIRQVLSASSGERRGVLELVGDEDSADEE
jgi:predicted RNA-binding protein YlqC (UPF0109 family)